MQNVVYQLISWHFFEVPREILKAWKNFLKFNLNYFSVPLLLKTLFSPWRRYKISRGQGFDLGKFFETLISNLIFRLLGAVIRSFLIFVGLLVELFIVFGGIIIFIGWLVLPAFLILGFIFGLKVLF